MLTKKLVKLLLTYFFGSRVTFWREEVVSDKLSFAQVVSCSLLDQLTPVSVCVVCKRVWMIKKYIDKRTHHFIVQVKDKYRFVISEIDPYYSNQTYMYSYNKLLCLF